MSSSIISQTSRTSVRKRSVAAELVRIVRRVAAMDGFQFDQFLTYLDNYQLARTQLLSSKHNGSERVQNLNLYCYTIRTCLESLQSQTVESLCCDLEVLSSQRYQIHPRFGNTKH